MYYKSTDPEVIEAHRQYRESIEKVRQVGIEFEALYPGSKAILSGSLVSDIHVFGLYFDPPQDDRIWTKPDRQAAYRQEPRRAVAPGIKGEERKRLEALRKEAYDAYHGSKPNLRASSEDFLAALGTDWSNLLMGGFAYFEHAGAIYIKTPLQLKAEVATESLGSEYDAALRAAKASPC